MSVIEATRVGQYRIYTCATESLGVKPATRHRRFSLRVTHPRYGSKMFHSLTRRQVSLAHDGAVLALELAEAKPKKRMRSEENGTWGCA